MLNGNIIYMIKDGKSDMNNMTLREKIGQLIVTGFPTAHIPEEYKKLIEEYKIGNTILFAYNVQSSEQLAALNAELQELFIKHTGVPGFIAIDQEGGRVTRMPSDATNVPGAMAIASTGRPENAYAAGRITARELRALGVNFNLAPVLDINNNKLNPVINVRSYGDTAETVIEYAIPMMKGLQDGDVLSTLKHFPGHGDTSVDSHIGLPVIEKTLEQLEELELMPFKEAIASGAECIMSAHILFPNIEPEKLPATMSRTIITDVLKGKLGYEGLITTDCLEMQAIQKFYGTAEGALGALKAGVHMLDISHTPALVIEAVERIEAAVQSGELPMSVIDEAVEKVLYYKKKYAAIRPMNLSIVGNTAHRRANEALSLDGICHLRGELPRIERGDGRTLFIGSYAYRSDLAQSSVNTGVSFPEVMGEAFEAARQLIDINPEQAEIDAVVQQAKGYEQIVVGLFNGRENSGQLKLVKALCEAGCKVTAIALGRPYDLEELDEEVCAIAAFEYTPLVFVSLVKILSGASKPTGKLSIAL